MIFQSTLPLRGATSRLCASWVSKHNFNPRSPYGERQGVPAPEIHRRISIHAPLTGSDSSFRKCDHTAALFQSTLPLRGATYSGHFVKVFLAFQSTLPLRGATGLVSSTSPPGPFQSTLPLRGATMAYEERVLPKIISIHAPLTGSDNGDRMERAILRHFNPRSPYGERPASRCPSLGHRQFQSTLPLRGATGSKRSPYTFLIYFNPRSPYGERPGLPCNHAFYRYFNPRSPYGERRYGAAGVQHGFLFQSTLPLRGATGFKKAMYWSREFQSTLPLRGATC